MDSNPKVTSQASLLNGELSRTKFMKLYREGGGHFSQHNNKAWSQGSSVGIEIRLRDGWPGFNHHQGAAMGFFLFTTESRPTLVPTQSPIQWVLRIKRPGP